MTGLDLTGLGAAAVSLGMGLAGNIKKTIVIRFAPGAYDPTTDTTAAGSTVSAECIPWKKRNERATQDQANPNRRMVLIETAALPPGTVITETATATLDGYQWQVKAAEQDPTLASWILELRR